MNFFCGLFFGAVTNNDETALLAVSVFQGSEFEMNLIERAKKTSELVLNLYLNEKVDQNADFVEDFRQAIEKARANASKAFKRYMEANSYHFLTDFSFGRKREGSVLLLGDWGTGKDLAYDVLESALAFDKDISCIVTLGDVYPAGRKRDQRKNYLNPMKRALSDRDVQVFAIPGNHDYM